MIVVGLDISTYVGLARSDGQEEFVGKCIHFDPKVADGWVRVQLIAQNVLDTLAVWKPDKAVIEDYALGMKKSPSTIVTQVEIGTMIRSCLYNLGIPWVNVRPNTLKKWTTGDGHAKKPAMAAACKERWGFNSPSDDVVDGFALAQYGHHLLTLEHLPVGVKNGYGKF
jgi:Holliday junction resolvasome RuvABC endonuclease subunit